jgi:hypothetical protein
LPILFGANKQKQEGERNGAKFKPQGTHNSHTVEPHRKDAEMERQ